VEVVMLVTCIQEIRDFNLSQDTIMRPMSVSRAMYEYLYCMLNGYPGKTLNPETAVYVLNSLNDMAVEIRERGMHRETFFLDCVQRVSGQLRQYGGKKKQTEVCIA
jgi:hypothetical protein